MTDYNKLHTLAGGGQDPGDGGRATAAALNYPEEVLRDEDGLLYIGDYQHHRIRVVPALDGTYWGQAMQAGRIYTIAGSGEMGFAGDNGPATAARFNGAPRFGLDRDGNLYVIDYFNSRIRLVPRQDGTYFGQPMRARHVYTIAGNGAWAYSGDGGPALAAALHKPIAVMVDDAGNLYIADLWNHRLRVIPQHDGPFWGQAMRAGCIYTIAGNGEQGFNGDGGPALAATLNGPHDVELDPAGNLVVADFWNHRIRLIPRQDGTYYGQAMRARHIYTIAGTGEAGDDGDGLPARQSRLNLPHDLAWDAAGNLYVADFGNHRIRVLPRQDGICFGMPVQADRLYTVAGNGQAGFTGDGGPATAGSLNTPFGIAIDPNGDLLVADTFNHRIRRVRRDPAELAPRPAP